MKQIKYIPVLRLILPVCFTTMLIFSQQGFAQDSAASTQKVQPIKLKPVKNTFESVWIIDNQTVMVPIKGTFEMNISHRFGEVTNGSEDLWGLYASANMRLGVSYAPIKNLFLGTGITKTKMLWDGSAKYAIIRQTKGQYPVSVTYYGNIAYDTRKDPNKTLFTYNSQRFSFFNQIIIARKITEKFSLQVAGSLSHQNSVNGFYTKNDSTGKTTFKKMDFDHLAVSVSARYKLSQGTAFLVNYDQPITKHNTNNPDPNLSFGFEFNTSGHAFQIFLGNYTLLNPQQNNLYNSNSPFAYTKTDGTAVKGGQFHLGFNITRLWNF